MKWLYVKLIMSFVIVAIHMKGYIDDVLFVMFFSLYGLDAIGTYLNRLIEAIEKLSEEPAIRVVRDNEKSGNPWVKYNPDDLSTMPEEIGRTVQLFNDFIALSGTWELKVLITGHQQWASTTTALHLEMDGATHWRYVDENYPERDTDNDI